MSCKETTPNENAEDFAKIAHAARKGDGLFQAVLRYMPIPYLLVDESENVLQTNLALIGMLQIDETVESCIGKKLAEVIYGDIKHETFMSKCIRYGKVYENIEVPAIGGRGKRLHVTASIFPLYGSDSVCIGGMCIYVDHAKDRLAQDALLGSENKYADLVKNISVGIVVHASLSSVIIANDQACKFLGLTIEQMKGKSYRDLPFCFIYEDRTPMSVDEHPVSIVFATHTPVQDFTLGINRPHANDQIWALVSAFPEFDSNGKVSRVVVTFVDITERKLAEEALVRSEKRYANAIAATSDGVWEWDLTTDETYYSQRWYEMLGYEGNVFPMNLETWKFLCHPDDLEVSIAAIQACLASVESMSFMIDFRMRAKSGEWLWIQGRGNVVERDAQGKPQKIAGTNTDITARKRAEFEANESRLLLNSVLDTIPVRVFWKDLDLCYLGCNKAFATDAGKKSASDLVGKNDYQMVWAEQAPCYRDDDIVVIESQNPKINYKEMQTTPDGRQIITNTSKIPLRNAHGQVIGVLGTYEDITLRQYNDEKYRVLFESSPDGIILIKDCRIIDCNEQILQLFNRTRDQIVGHGIEDISPPIQPGGVPSAEIVAKILQQALKGGQHTFEWQHLRGDDSLFSAEVSLAALHLFGETCLVAFLRDISERNHMQELMVQTEKMVSLGGIAAGIAHEINNPLGIVLQAAQNLQQRMRPDFSKNIQAAEQVGLDLEVMAHYARERKLDVFIKDIQLAAIRASEIIRHMLDFSRRSESKRKECDLTEVIDNALNLARSDYDLKKGYDFKRIRIERYYGDCLPIVQCTETEIEQVLLNLLRNAAQAMAAADPPVESPCITIRLTGQERLVRIEVADNGPGMTREVLHRIFEPFYTTKPTGMGTGLGLSVSYFIVTKGHGGRMTVFSLPSVGTTFAIELPLHDSL